MNKNEIVIIITSVFLSIYLFVRKFIKKIIELNVKTSFISLKYKVKTKAENEKIYKKNNKK